MITKKKIKVVIDEAHLKFEDCWNFLLQMRLLDIKASFSEDLLNFQPDLCEALLKLGKTYQAIANEREDLVLRKKHLNETWFANRMATLSQYQKAIEKCIYIGKSLGDSFAWIFYEHERSLLAEHLKHEEIPYLPSGIGVTGELEFIKKGQGFGRCFVIYHGITTFLRLGDVSFFDFSTHKIVDLGELKTRRIDKEHIEISIVFAKWNPEEPSMIIEQPLLVHSRIDEMARGSVQMNFPPKMKSRLVRQLRSMAESFVRSNNKPDIIKNMNVGMYLEVLNDLLHKCNTKELVYEKLSPGLLLIACRHHHQSLSAKLIAQSISNIEQSKDEIQDNVLSILDQTRNDNIIYTNCFYYDKHGHASYLAGTVPLFWWPLDIKLIKAVVFRDIDIITIFNPKYLVKKLEDSGWKGELNIETGKFILTKISQGRTMRLENFIYFVKLVMNYLLKEEAVVDLISDAFSSIKQEELPLTARIELQIHQIFGGPPNI